MAHADFMFMEDFALHRHYKIKSVD